MDSPASTAATFHDPSGQGSINHNAIPADLASDITPGFTTGFGDPALLIRWQMSGQIEIEHAEGEVIARNLQRPPAWTEAIEANSATSAPPPPDDPERMLLEDEFIWHDRTQSAATDTDWLATSVTQAPPEIEAEPLYDDLFSADQFVFDDPSMDLD